MTFLEVRTVPVRSAFSSLPEQYTPRMNIPDGPKCETFADHCLNETKSIAQCLPMIVPLTITFAHQNIEK